MARNPGYSYDAKDFSGRRPYDPRDDYVAPPPGPPPSYDDCSQAPLRRDYNCPPPQQSQLPRYCYDEGSQVRQQHQPRQYDYDYDSKNGYGQRQLAPSCGMDSPLPFPVVIPQQRMGSKDRGFMAAYAPSLAACGIDRMTFLKFIDDVNIGLQGNKYLAGVQVVAFGVGLTPETIVMGVSAAVQAGAMIANKAAVRNKTNMAMDKYNNEVFRPRGLFCMIMKYDPIERDPADLAVEDGGPFKKLSNLVSGGSPGQLVGPGNQQQGPTKQDRFRNPISGKVNGESNLPTAVAPLEYIQDRRAHKELLSSSRSVSRDSSSSSDGDKPQKKENRASKAFGSFNDYLDRRARAKYACENEGSILNVPTNGRFNTRFLDPNHPATNGGLIGLISGGSMTPDAETRKRKKMARIEEEESRVYEEYQRRIDDVYRSRQSQRETDRALRDVERDYSPRLAEFRNQKKEIEGGVRSIKKDILYLSIVNLPSETAMAEAQQRSGWQNPVAMTDI